MFFVDSLVIFADDAIVAERLKEEVKLVFSLRKVKSGRNCFEEVQNEKMLGKC